MSRDQINFLSGKVKPLEFLLKQVNMTTFKIILLRTNFGSVFQACCHERRPTFCVSLVGKAPHKFCP